MRLPSDGVPPSSPFPYDVVSEMEVEDGQGSPFRTDPCQR